MVINFRKPKIMINGKGSLINREMRKNVHPGISTFSMFLSLEFYRKDLLASPFYYEHLESFLLYFFPFRSSIKSQNTAITRGISPQMAYKLTPVNTITDFENVITFSTQLDQDLQKINN